MEGRWVAPAMFVALLLALSGPLGRWGAGVLVVLAAPELLRALRAAASKHAAGRQLADAGRRWLPHGLLMLVGLVLLHELALGRAPASRDHGVHLFQTRVLVEELLPNGQLRGWTQSLNGGYPFGDSYPVLGYVLTGAASVITGGAVGLRTSYAWGLLAVWVLSIAAVVVLARVVAREVFGAGDESESSRPATARAIAWAGAIAGVAWLLDPGTSRQGGWNYLMFHGVWPQQLSTAFWVLGQVALWNAVRIPTPRRLSLAALTLGGCLLAHPFGALTLAGSAIAWIPALIWASREERLPAGSWRWWVVVHGGATLLAIGWWMSFVASADAMGRSPVPFEPLSALAADLLAGELFAEGRGWTSVAALIGLVLAIRRGALVAAVVTTSFVGLMVAASQDAITVLGLDLIASGFKNLQFPRYTIALKPLWAALAGIGVVWLARAASCRAMPGSHNASEPRFGLWRWLAPVLLGPLLASTCAEPSRVIPRPVGGVHALESTAHAGADRTLAEHLERERRATRAMDAGRDQPLRVAFLRANMSGATYALFAITDAGAALVLDQHVPAINFRHVLLGRDLTTLRALGVTHVLHDRPLPKDEAELAAELETIGTAGVWTLHRLRGASTPNPSARVVRPPAAISGPVPGTPIERGWSFDIPRSTEDVGVAVTVAPYRKWRAETPSGQVLSVTAARVRPGLPGMVVTTRGPFVLRYAEGVTERRAVWLSWGALGIAFLALGFSTALAPLPRRPLGPVLVVAGALGIVGLFGLDRMRSSGLQRSWVAADGGDAELAADPGVEVRDLVMEDAWSLTERQFPACDGLLGRDARAGCERAAEAERVGFSFRDPYLYRCLDFVVDPGHHRDLVWSGLREDEHFVALLDVPKGSLDLDMLDGDDPDTLRRGRPHRVRVRPDQGRVAMRLHNDSRTLRHVCVAAAAIRGGGR